MLDFYLCVSYCSIPHTRHVSGKCFIRQTSPLMPCLMNSGKNMEPFPFTHADKMNQLIPKLQHFLYDSYFPFIHSPVLQCGFQIPCPRSLPLPCLVVHARGLCLLLSYAIEGYDAKFVFRKYEEKLIIPPQSNVK